MQEIIASFDYSNHEISPDCLNVFHLGVKVIEREFKTTIDYHISHDKLTQKAELLLKNMPSQEWLSDATSRDIIVYKLSTHLKICLSQFVEEKEAAEKVH